jgi:hypothetical protein
VTKLNAIVNSVFNEKQRNEEIKTQTENTNSYENKPLEQLIKEKIFQLFKNQQKTNN